MPILLLAILSSASMAIVLKIFGARPGNRYGILLGNYLVCILLSLALMPRKSLLLSASAASLLCGAVGGCLFVAGLVSMQSSIRRSGATLTAAFAKLGLLVPLALSVLLFGERPGVGQLLGILLVLPAMVLINGGEKPEEGGAAPSFPLLLLTLLFSGSADAMAKVFDQAGPSGEDTVYFFFLFLTAALVTALLARREKKRTGEPLRPLQLAAGALVGVPNYFSSFLLLRALGQLPAFLVYPIYSTGTLLLVTAVSALLLHERPGKKQWIGIGLILAALALLNL